MKKSELVLVLACLLLLMVMDIFIFMLYFEPAPVYLEQRASSFLSTPYSLDDTSTTNDYQESIGYVLATHYVDQLSGATINVISLQCWASTLPGKIEVVEPFLHYGSMLGVTLDINTADGESLEYENNIHLFDMYEERHWRVESDSREFSPLVSWNDFLHHSPRKLILVDKICSNNSLCMSCEEINFFESPLFAKSAETFASVYNFSIVRKVCYENRRYSMEEFNSNIYGNFSPNQVVVLFNHFGGFALDDVILRLNVDLNINCYRAEFFGMLFPIHQDIYHQSRKYVATYMPNVTSSGYISVMLRTEQFARSQNFQNLPVKEQMNQTKFCVHKLVQKVKELKESQNISDIFLSTDTGKYGSAYFRHIKASHYLHEEVLKFNSSNKFQENSGNYFFQKGVLETGLLELHNRLFGKVLDLDKRVDSVALYKTPGYVALLEMALAAKGTCLVQAGGGKFHENTATWHEVRFMRDCGVHNVMCS